MKTYSKRYIYNKINENLQHALVCKPILTVLHIHNKIFYKTFADCWTYSP